MKAGVKLLAYILRAKIHKKIERTKLSTFYFGKKWAEIIRNEQHPPITRSEPLPAAKHELPLMNTNNS